MTFWCVYIIFLGLAVTGRKENWKRDEKNEEDAEFEGKSWGQENKTEKESERRKRWWLKTWKMRREERGGGGRCKH